MVFCNKENAKMSSFDRTVTILILIDGFLQYAFSTRMMIGDGCHNPYFNRWFSAMKEETLTLLQMEGHNPYFNRWFSAIQYVY